MVNWQTPTCHKSNYSVGKERWQFMHHCTLVLHTETHHEKYRTVNSAFLYSMYTQITHTVQFNLFSRVSRGVGVIHKVGGGVGGGLNAWLPRIHSYEIHLKAKYHKSIIIKPKTSLWRLCKNAYFGAMNINSVKWN